MNLIHKRIQRRSSTCIAALALSAFALPLVSPLSLPARAQLFGGGGANAEKIVVTAQNTLKLGDRLAATGQFAQSMKTYQAAAQELQAAREADSKVSDERAGKDNDGPSGEELSDLFAKRVDELKGLVGKGGLSPEETTHEVWERYETVKLNFGDGGNASPSDWEELARFLRVGIARLEGAFASQGNLKTSVIPNQGRVETRGAALLADFKNAFAQADKKAALSRPKNLSANAPVGTGAEPTIMQRSRMRSLLDQAPKAGDFLAGAGTEADAARRLEETAREVDALLADYPALKDEVIQSGDPARQNIKGSALPGLYRAGIAALGGQVKRIAAEDAAMKLTQVAGQFETETSSLDRALRGVQNNGFISWGFSDVIVGSSKHLAQRRAYWQKQYPEQTGKPMPADFLKPLETRMAALKAAIEQKAPTWKWTGGGTNAAMEAKARSFVQSQFHAKVLRTAMADEGWGIQKNELDIPTLRWRSVRVLAQFPGEKWARQFNVGYAQDYAGGGTYASGATINGPIDFRWMKAQ